MTPCNLANHRLSGCHKRRVLDFEVINDGQHFRIHRGAARNQFLNVIVVSLSRSLPRFVCSSEFINVEAHADPLKLSKGNLSMITNPAQITRHHLANQATPAYSLIRKVCACGKASTAKQLTQHGKCATCALAAVRDAIMPGDFAKLQHMLGAVQHYPKTKWGWRNYYCANISGTARGAMQRLVDAGLVTAGHESDTQANFHATRLGCKAAGLDAAGIKRAMEDAS
jgi:hypothetical protein